MYSKLFGGPINKLFVFILHIQHCVGLNIRGFPVAPILSESGNASTMRINVINVTKIIIFQIINSAYSYYMLMKSVS